MSYGRSVNSSVSTQISSQLAALEPNVMPTTPMSGMIRAMEGDLPSIASPRGGDIGVCMWFDIFHSLRASAYFCTQSMLHVQLRISIWQACQDLFLYLGGHILAQYLLALVQLRKKHAKYSKVWWLLLAIGYHHRRGWYFKYMTRIGVAFLLTWFPKMFKTEVL